MNKDSREMNTNTTTINELIEFTKSTKSGYGWVTLNDDTRIICDIQKATSRIKNKSAWSKVTFMIKKHEDEYGKRISRAKLQEIM